MPFANGIQSSPNSLRLKVLHSPQVKGCLIFHSSAPDDLLPLFFLPLSCIEYACLSQKHPNPKLTLSYLKTKPGDKECEAEINCDVYLDSHRYIINGIFILLLFCIHDLCPCQLAFAWGRYENLFQTETEHKEKERGNTWLLACKNRIGH